MTKHLFIFTISPVQSFISQSRKTQDLYSGSHILSKLTDMSMKKLNDITEHADFIFPKEDQENKPNRFIAIIEGDNIGSVGNELKLDVEAEFEKIALYVLQNSNIEKNSGKFHNKFIKQIRDHLDINWVSIPLTNNNYYEKYKKLESYLGAVKNMRNFSQLEETGRKCSLCGERNVLIYRQNDNEKGRLETRKDGLLKKLYVKEEEMEYFIPEKDEDELKVGRGEGLCGVCFLKRFADLYFDQVDVFPSVSEISLMDTIHKIDDPLLTRYRDLFESHFDAELFYEENLTEKYCEKYNYPKVVDGRNKLRNIHERAKEDNLRLTKYYAILRLDGDSMGKWLSGYFLENKSELLDFHRKVTSELGKYSEKIDNIICKPKGKKVYAGGDDVLAFVNLNHLMDVIKEVRNEFPKFEDLGYEIKNQKKSTASAGIAIAHYKDPLPIVLDWSHRMEKNAKSTDGKDAFSIAVLKRSGEIVKTRKKWEYDDKNTIDMMDELIDSLLSDDFSNKFIINLIKEFSRLIDQEGEYGNHDIIESEMKRMISKACEMEQKEDESKKEFRKRKNRKINELFSNLKILLKKDGSLDNFFSFLKIADFMQRRLNHNDN